MSLFYKSFFAIFIIAFVFTGCANHAKTNLSYENALTQQFCDDKFFDENLEKVKKGEDPIFIGLNVGLIARNCGKFDKSIDFFDIVEESYKNDVDLENFASKGGKLAATTLINDTIVDYQGSLYERIMVNTYKGLNFMSVGDYANARVEFNRALMRQDKAKEYFAKQIEKNQKELEKAKEDPNYEKNMGDNIKTINEKYDHLFESFETSKNFVNPYATYLASVFFYLDKDYRKAADLFREVAIINPKNKEIQKEFKFIKNLAKSANPNKAKNKIFVVYENGKGVIVDEFKFILPFFLANPIVGRDGNKQSIVSTSIALKTLKKRDGSYENIAVNGVNTSNFVDLDNVIATEFKIQMPSMITKAVASTIIKTTLNAVVANNDSSGGLLTLASSFATVLATKADVRSWGGLPKSISVAMIENNGEVDITDPTGKAIFSTKLDKDKDALIIVRSFQPILPTNTTIIQK